MYIKAPITTMSWFSFGGFWFANTTMPFPYYILSLILRPCDERKIIVYSRSIINACSYLSHEWWVSLIKFMMGPTIHVRGPTIHVRGGSIYLWYSEST